MSKVFSFLKAANTSSAYEKCLETHLERLWHLALRLERNPADAEDLLQDLLQRAWRNRKTLQEMNNPGAWLAKVLYRLHVDRWRRNRVQHESQSLDDERSHAGDLPDTNVTTGLDSVAYSELTALINELPEQQRTVLIMHDAEGYTLEEISAIQDTPVGTMKSRLHRARAAIREKINRT